MKKLVGILLTLAMVVAMSITTFAANITIDGTGGVYKAYKLLNATNANDATDKTKFAYTLNDKYATILTNVTGKTDGAAIVEDISSKDVEGIRSFADAVYGQITKSNPAINADYTTTNNKFEGVAQGYYLIVETATADGKDTYSLVMLDTVGVDDIVVKSKEDAPTLEKKVQEKNDSTNVTSDWQDGADYDVNDKVPFKLTGTVSKKYDNYKGYYYAFHDKMSRGLSFNRDTVVVNIVNDDKAITVGTGQYEVITRTIEDDEDTEFNGGTEFDVIIKDLKKCGVEVTGTSKITVEYTATLNNNAVIGSVGNPNEARLEYSNNPYGTGTGKTPEDKVIVFTYKLIANKVDKDGNALNGAAFTLYKWDKEANDYKEVEAKTAGTENSEITQFEFTRLDAGKYKLVETTVPAGYNKADDLEFTVDATYDTESADPKLTALVIKDKDNREILSGEGKVFTVNVEEGYATTDIKNFSGTELPSTGGMGTTILYVVGAILVIGAGILLVTKKRMNANK